MPSATLEPNVSEEIRRAQELDQPDRRIAVLIELSEPAELPPGGHLADLEQRVRRQQAGLLEHLSTLGVGSVRQAMLANAIGAGLTPSEIAEIARRDDVRTIRLDREEQVTT